MISLRNILADVKSGTSHSVDFLLQDDVESTVSKYGIALRKILAPVLRVLYRSKTKYKIVIVKREKLHRSPKGKIFAINHFQGDDIVIGANAVGQSGYFVFGNRYLALETLNGLGLWAYGMILLNRDATISRKATYEKMKFVLEHGGNIIIYPEGYWNLADNGQKDERHGADGHNSENWLVQDINIGIIRLAAELGCEIVPTILHYDSYKKKSCYALRGKPFYVRQEENLLEKKEELVTVMQTMYYEVMEKYSSYCRRELEDNGYLLREQWEKEKEEFIRACDIERIGYRLDLADEKRIGKAKVMQAVTTPEEAFGFLKRIETL